MAAILKIDMTS